MLTRAGVAFGAVVLVAAIGLGAWQHSSPERAQAVEQWFLYGPRPEQGQSHSITISIDTDGQAWAQDAKGERTPVGWVKTQVTSAESSVSGTLRFLNQDVMAMISLPTKSIGVEAGLWRCAIEDISTAGDRWWTPYVWNGPTFDTTYVPPNPPTETAYLIVSYILCHEAESVAYEMAHFEYHYLNVEETPWDIEIPFSISVSGATLERREVQTPDTASRSDAVNMAYSQELADENRWQGGPYPMSWDVTFGEFSSRGTQEWDEVFQDWNPIMADIGSVAVTIVQHKGYEGTQYAQWDLEWDRVDFNFSRYHKDKGSWKLEGNGKSIEMYMTATSPSLNASERITVYRPFPIDLSEFGVWDRDGTLIEDLCCVVPMQGSNHYPASLDWSTTPDGQTTGAADPGDTVYPTVKELRDVATYFDPPGITGMDYRDPDDQYGLLTSYSAFTARLTQESVEHYATEYGHDPEDLRIGFLVPGIDATRMDAEPDYEGLLALTHAATASLYGPSGDPAHDHEDWVGSDGATSPDAGGAFTVGAGTDPTLTLALANNRENRLSKIHEQNFPVGMPGAPDMLNYKRAGIYRAYDGVTCPDGITVWEEPPEGNYCAHGFSALDLNLSGGVASTLQVALTVLTSTHTDWHWTSGTRQEDYEVAFTPRTIEYELDYVPGQANQILLAVPSNADTVGYDPDLEIVTQVEISGFGQADDWAFSDDPQWSRDLSSAEVPKIKFFEGAIEQYRDGGHSAVVDSVAVHGLFDTEEDNKQHGNIVELKTLRNFDFIESEPPPDGPEIRVDHTGVYSLDQLAVRMTNVCNAWSATVNDEVRDAMCYDAETDAYYSQLYAFNVRAPRDAEVPLVQDVGNLNGAIIVGSVQLVQGVTTALRGYKIISGSMHGLMLDNTGKLARNATGEQVWWQPADESEAWALHDTPQSNSAGYWRATSGAVYHAFDPAELLRDYGTGSNPGAITSSGRWATREYDWTTLATSSVPGAPWLHWMAGGWLHIAVTIDSIVRYYWVEPFRATPILREADAHPFGEEGGFQNPFITSYACGWLLVGATEEEGYMRLSRSEVFGDAWEEVTGGTLVDDLRNGCVDISDGFLIACGWKEGSVLFRTTSGRSFTPEAIHYGGPDNSVICESDAVDDDAPRSQVRWRNGAIEAMVETATGANLYRSRDWGTTWTQIEAPHIADGMRGGNLAFIDGELLACGTEEGEVRAETAYRDTRVPESWWWTGPTYLTVVETAIASAIEAVHGERWVATGEDGISLYRLRNPFAGFEKII